MYLIRLQYREQIARLVADIVMFSRNKNEAVSTIKQYAAREVDDKDRSRFVEVVETELMSLHEGNIARYRIRPTQFEQWKTQW